MARPVLKERAYLPYWGAPARRHLFWNLVLLSQGFLSCWHPQGPVLTYVQAAQTPRPAPQPIPQLAIAMRNEIPGPVTRLVASPGLPLPLPLPAPSPPSPPFSLEENICE